MTLAGIYKNFNRLDQLQEIDAAWEIVRRAKTTKTVVSAADIWLQALWPHARRLGLTTHTTAYDLCPEIVLVDTVCEPDNFGCYVVSENLIEIAPAYYQNHLAKIEKTSVPVEVRETIVHETQHAFDHVSGRDLFSHDGWFNRRLQHLRDLFPCEGL